MRSVELKAIVVAMALFYLGGRAISAEALARTSKRLKNELERQAQAALSQSL